MPEKSPCYNSFFVTEVRMVRLLISVMMSLFFVGCYKYVDGYKV